MKSIFIKLGTVFAVIVAAIGCTVAPTLPPTSLPAEPTSCRQTTDFSPLCPPPTNLPAGPTTAPTLATWTDDFNGALASGWVWGGEDPTHWSLKDAPGALQIVTQGESLYAAGKPKNLLSRDAPASDFEITTKVTFDPHDNFQQAAILIYQDEDNFVLLDRGFCEREGCPGSGIFLDNEMRGEADFTKSVHRTSSFQTTWLRLRREGTRYIGFYSGDGQKWEELGGVENSMTPTKVGLTANNSNDDPSVPQIPADFDSFTVQRITLSTDTSLNVITETPTTNVSMALTPDQILAKISVGDTPFRSVSTEPCRVAIGEGAIWVTDPDGAAVYRIDPQTNRVVATISLGGSPNGLVVGDSAIWVANQGGLSRIDPQTNQVVATIRVGKGLNAAVGVDSVWVTSTSGVVSRIDPETNQVIASITVGGTPSQIAIANDTVWVANRESTSVSRIDPQTNQVAVSIDVGFSTLALATDQDSVWVAGYSDATLLRIDPQTNQVVARIPVGVSPWGIAADPDVVWVTSNSNKTLWRIDPQTNQVTAAYKVGWGPLGVGIGDGDLWVVTSFDHVVWRIKL